MTPLLPTFQSSSSSSSLRHVRSWERANAKGAAQNLVHLSDLGGVVRDSPPVTRLVPLQSWRVVRLIRAAWRGARRASPFPVPSS